MKREKIFTDEAQLCDAFMAWARRNGFTVYPETAGWDVLLVDAGGRQTGVQAKMSLNAKVIEQTIIPIYSWSDEGPDHRAVLIPEFGGFTALVTAAGIGVFAPDRNYRHYGKFVGAQLEFVVSDHERWHHRALFDWNPTKRHELPVYVPDVRAGMPSPIQLTDWKVKALRLLAILARDGWVTAKEIRELGMDSRRWCTHYLVPHASGHGHWARGRQCPAFDMQHPDVYAQIVAETPEKTSPGLS